MKKALAIILTFIIILSIIAGVISTKWVGTWMNNQVDYVNQKIDDATNYETRKSVEDSCRSMIAYYEADKLTWEQYRDSDDNEKRSWADQAKMRANRTASNYNNYILKNSYVWNDNIPADIMHELPIIA